MGPGFQRLWLVWGLVAVLGFHILLGLYATALNELFYAYHGPFFDSLGYYNNIAQMEVVAQERGAWAGFVDAVYGSTVVYPWLIIAPLMSWIEPSRSMGVFVQVFAAACMQLALFFYFHRVRGRSWPESFVYSGAFVLIAAAFKHNGGLADFRMDLLQYFLVTTTMATYLIASHLGRRRWWVLMGVCAGLSCLGRTTSPVYLVPIFAVLFAADLFIAREAFRKVALRWGLAAVAAAVVSGWYFVSNFDYLHYYRVLVHGQSGKRTLGWPKQFKGRRLGSASPFVLNWRRWPLKPVERQQFQEAPGCQVRGFFVSTP